MDRCNIYDDWFEICRVCVCVGKRMGGLMFLCVGKLSKIGKFLAVSSGRCRDPLVSIKNKPAYFDLAPLVPVISTPLHMNWMAGNQHQPRCV